NSGEFGYARDARGEAVGLCEAGIPAARQARMPAPRLAERDGYLEQHRDTLLLVLFRWLLGGRAMDFGTELQPIFLERRASAQVANQANRVGLAVGLARVGRTAEDGRF